MQTLSQPQELRERCLGLARNGARVALVPTMGFLHQGHASLMRWARDNADVVVLSVFVNPTQFGPSEDLGSYPRDAERDADLARACGVDIMFMPEARDMFPEGYDTWVEVPSLARHLCGVSRPTHFRGVATVVTKLLILACPTLAVFGQKDWQQLAIIKRLSSDLGLPTRIVGRPTVREPDGLAMSSRNSYLSPEERAQAPCLHAGLGMARELVRHGERSASRIKDSVSSYLASHLPLGRIDYLEIVHPDTISPLAQVDGPALLAAAVHLGRARIIDNVLLAEHRGQDQDAP